MNTIVNQTSHPLEDIFDIVPNSTEVVTTVVEPKQLIEHPMYDQKDSEIEQQLEQVYSTAMSQALTLSDEIEKVEGKYKARMGEVSSTMLNVALGALREKANIKINKDRNNSRMPATVVSAGGTVNNNVVVADRNELLRMFVNNQTIIDQ